ncbi:MAG: hypothetical protein V4671_18235, partial [Armatimonadota bacterium]
MDQSDKRGEESRPDTRSERDTEEEEVSEERDSEVVDEADSRPAVMDGYASIAFSVDDEGDKDGEPLSPTDHSERGDKYLKEGHVSEALGQ